MAKEVVVTREGYNKLEQELENLRTVKRKEVADKIKVARECRVRCRQGRAGFCGGPHCRPGGYPEAGPYHG